MSLNNTFAAPAKLKRAASGEADPGLAFMLAQQAATQWQLDAERLEEAADRTADTAATITEADALVPQIAALEERIRPFANYLDLAIRFEAQEILAALEAVRTRLGRLSRRLQPPTPWRDPAQLVAELLERRH